MANRKLQIAISLVHGIGPVITRNLVSYFGSVEQIFGSSDAELLKFPHITKKILESLRSTYILDRAEQELNFIQKNEVQVYFYTDNEFPRRLEFCEDAPLLLYGKGNMNFNAKRVISIVGSRTTSQYGREMAEKIVTELKELDVLVISGLALGIDISAHKSAVKNNLQTIGCLAHGIETIYPPSSRVTAAQMLKNGGVMTEFLSGTLPARENFPNRNRVIAGMCDCLLVVESKQRGGSMISADLAYGYHKDVFAIPGKATDKLSEGCNNLIKYKKAQMVTSGKDIAREMNWDLKTKSIQPELFPVLNQNQKVTLAVIRDASRIHIDELGAKTGLDYSALASTLLELEFDGLIRSLPGKSYESA